MARTSKAGAGGQPPHKHPDDTPTLEGIHHDHHDDDGNVAESHLHRLGHLRHIHLEDGKVEFADGRPAELIPLPDPHGPSDELAAKHFPGPTEAQREEQRADLAGQRRAEIAAAVTDDDIAEMEEIRERLPYVQPNGLLPPRHVIDQPRSVAVSGAPGSRLADVTALVSTWTLLGFPVELQDELTQIQLAKQTLDEMLEDILRNRQLSDPRLVSALVDTTDHIARARGLVRGGGAQ
jgi:hypothetical protein